MGKPIVSTSLGAEGIDVVDGEHLLIADGADSFAEKVVLALRDASLASALGTNGRAFAESHLSWGAAAAKLVDFHSELLVAREVVRARRAPTQRVATETSR